MLVRLLAGSPTSLYGRLVHPASHTPYLASLTRVYAQLLGVQYLLN